MNAGRNEVRASAVGVLGAAWGIAGVTTLLGFAVVRLGRHALELFALPLEPVHWAALGISVGFMTYSEGYRGFQRAFSPRTAARALHLSRAPRPLHVALAPVFCMGFFHATRRRMIASFALTAMIVTFVVIARQLDQPWRGILDAGVVAGLVWGIATLLLNTRAAFTNPGYDASPELPHERGSGRRPGAIPSAADAADR